MAAIAAFHEVVFPLSIALGATAGPERRTEIVALSSGYEVRNARWAASRRRYDAGSGIKTLDDLHVVIAFFEERRGRLHGFRFRDRTDWKSCAPSATPTANDQVIGTGDGTTKVFQLVKRYGSIYAPYDRIIEKPVTGTSLVSVNGNVLAGGTYSVNSTTGKATLDIAPANGAIVRAGFQFDVPVRFDTDRLSVNLSHFSAGDIPAIPMIEVRS